MKATLLFLALATASILLSGCATDPGDQAFFQRGWINPSKYDMSMSRTPGL